MKAKFTLDYIRENGLILLEAISGSNAYGTNTPESDVDIRGVFILPEEYVLGFGYVEQISDNTNDVTFYEVGRFLQLLESNNPNMLELLNVPEDCMVYKHPLFDYILDHKEEFLTKQCRNSIAGYARQQIKKATGLNKKQNWERDKVNKKDILDFCYVLDGSKTRPIKHWFERMGYPSDAQKFCGVVNVPNARDTYALYYDSVAANCFSVDEDEYNRERLKRSLKLEGENMGIGYKGIAKLDDDNNPTSNQLRLSSIPKGQNPVCNFIYNKDGYTQHCKEYREYQEWLEKRNETRYTEVKGHGQKIDGKNMMHCKRLIEMSKEIAEGKGVIVRRPNAKELLGIRRGEVSLSDLLEWAENELNSIDEMFENSNLPLSVDRDMTHELLVKIRREFYGK